MSRNISHRVNIVHPPDVKPAEVVYDIEVITPLYGGGVEAGVNEQSRPIRTTSIRGNLRFWWRATRGTLCASLKELREKESEIWGSTEKRSSTLVKVECSPYSQRREKANDYGFRSRYGPETYAIFPAVNQSHALVKEGLPFKLYLQYKKEHESDVQCALWAWLNFGGLGARTRRGCGALYCGAFAPPNSAGFASWLTENMRKYGIKSSSIADLPVLSNKVLYRDNLSDAIAAWGVGLSVLKDFRQKRNPGRDRRPGRSHWPEPDSLRKVFGRNAPMHKPDPSMPEGFPRAQFGLPIVFHFRDRDDPVDTELYPAGKKRMASPLILRPIRTRDNKFLSAAIFLDGTRLNDLELTRCRRTFNKNSFADPKFTVYRNSPMSGLSKKGDALEAFQNYLKTQRYR